MAAIASRPRPISRMRPSRPKARASRARGTSRAPAGRAIVAVRATSLLPSDPAARGSSDTNTRPLRSVWTDAYMWPVCEAARAAAPRRRSLAAGVRQRVHECAVLLELPVDVRSRRHAGHADRRDDLTLGHLLARCDEHGTEVVVARLEPVGVLDPDRQPADRDPPGEHDRAVLRSADAGAVSGREVDSRVECPEVLSDPTAHRPREP